MDLADSEKEYNYSDSGKIWMIIFFLVGIITGTLIFNCLNTYEQTKIMIYSGYVSGRIRIEHVDRISLFKYVSVYRIKEILLLLIFGITQYKFVLHSGYIFYLGMKNAILLSIITAIYRKMAILYFTALVMPQIFVYTYIVCYIVRIFNFERVNYRSTGKIEKITVIAILYVLMCLLEAFVNPVIISMV